MILALLAMFVGATVSRSDDAKYPVKMVSYATGSRGARLTWLPYRPMATSVRDEAAESGVSRAQFEAPAPPGETASDAIRDPFGDKASSANPTTLPVLPANEVVGPGVEASPMKAAPKNTSKSLPQLWAASEAKQRDAQATTEGGGPQMTPAPDKRRIPTLEQELATNAPRGEEQCPPTAEFKPISEISNQIAAKAGNFPPECPLKSGDFVPRAWSQTNFAWTASGLCHKPLYFEDVQLERYGHSWGPYLQPVISHGHFFLTVPILPYLMGVEPPCECMYTLGYYRPGSCAPYMLDPLPISVRGALIEAGVWTGATYLIP